MARLFVSMMLLLSFHAAAEQPLTQEQALLWRITAPQQKVPSYLFGTIHSEDARVLELPPAVKQAFNESSRFVMEIVPDAAVSAQLNRRMMLPEHQPLSSLVGAELYEQTRAAMEKQGIPAEATERMKPWALVMILSMPKPKSGHFLDEVLYDMALHSGKQTGGLETPDEQIDALDGLSMPVQIVLLRQTLEHYQEIPAITESLIDAWLRRDLVEMQRLGEESNEGLPGDIEQLLQSRLIDVRNRRMAERITPMVKEGGVFVAVGALHLPGAQGLIALLRQRGFSVQPVY